MMVKMIAQIAMPALCPVTGAVALGLALLAKIATPSTPNTDQIAANVNTPAQMAPQLTRGTL
jgi:hypothetical protein